jgi:prefoldin subunit 5
MNNDRRKEIDKAIKILDGVKSEIESFVAEHSDKLEEAKGIIEGAKEGEEEALESMPDNMKSGERGEAMQAAIDAMDEAANSIDDAMGSLDTAKE